MRLLIDGDIVAYRCAAAAQDTTYTAAKGDDPYDQGEIIGECRAGEGVREFRKWAKEMGATVVKHVDPGPVENAMHLAGNMMQEMCEYVAPTEGCRTYLSCEGDTFRHKLAKIRPYKGNRKAEDKPHHVDAVKDYLVRHWAATSREELEADDLIGINYKPGDIIASLDKDLDMIPGTRYDFVKKEYIDNPPEIADRNFYLQLLTGDSTDNVLGIPGIGQKKAEKYLPTLMSRQEMWDHCCLAYYEAWEKEKWSGDDMARIDELGMGWREVILENATLLWIMREDKPWEPEFPFPELEEEDDDAEGEVEGTDAGLQYPYPGY